MMPTHQFTKLRLSIFVSDCSAEGNYEGLLLLPIGLFKGVVVYFVLRSVGFVCVSARELILIVMCLSGAKVCSEDMVATVGIRL